MTALEKKNILDSKAQEKEKKMFQEFTQKSEIAKYLMKKTSLKAGHNSPKLTRNIRQKSVSPILLSPSKPRDKPPRSKLSTLSVAPKLKSKMKSAVKKTHQLMNLGGH